MKIKLETSSVMGEITLTEEELKSFKKVAVVLEGIEDCLRGFSILDFITNYQTISEFLYDMAFSPNVTFDALIDYYNDNDFSMTSVEREYE